ncbi:MAG: radical SAM protein [Thiotrichaceae bacterium]
MTQLNTPYPATAYITGFLREQGYDVAQRDLAIELLLTMLSRQGLSDIHQRIEERFADMDDADLPDSIYNFFTHYQTYLTRVEPTIRFLQGKDPSLALRVASRHFLPEGPKFSSLDEMEATVGDVLNYAFGDLGTQDKAKYIATLFIDDLVDIIHDGVDPYFEISRYGEKLAASNPSFDNLYDVLKGELTYSELGIRRLLDQYLADEQPDFIGITIPFPGNVLGAMQIGKYIKEIAPSISVAFGGGYVNTELRSLNDPRVFEFVDYISLDDGERPLLTLLEHLQGKRTVDELIRTFHINTNINNAEVVYTNNTTLADIRHKDIGTPTYDGLPIENYLSLCEMLNAMHRIWSDGRWNKLTIAHGCYWSKCSFCDVSLDYIGRYDEAGADLIIERIETLIAETGQTGFHFVDEAAPPKVLFAMAEKLIKRGITITWWGNIRFEKTFTPEKCQLLADSGCVAISGGLEVASDRLLALMQKGVTVQQVARVTKGFADAGILVHAYLMYGFPTQTKAETILSLEYVRQLMLNNCFQSAYWHRFSSTIHSPVGLHPEEYGITLNPPSNIQFASNDVDFIDPTNADHDMLGRGLKKALYNYMHGVGFEEPVDFWFEQDIELPDIETDFIEQSLL